MKAQSLSLRFYSLANWKHTKGWLVAEAQGRNEKNKYKYNFNKKQVCYGWHGKAWIMDEI